MQHFRGPQPVPNWPTSVINLPSGFSSKFVDNVQQAAEAKSINPGLVRILRHWEQNQICGPDYESNKFIAREYLLRFIDETYLNGSTAGVPHRTTEYIEDYNEYAWFGSQTQQEKDMWTSWALAILDVWYEEFFPSLGTNIIMCNIPIGNNCDLRVVKRIHQWTNPQIGRIPRLGYHSYWLIKNNQLYNEADNWRYYAGRWAFMDAEYLANGYRIYWALTEAGSLGYHILSNGVPSLHPNDGWLHAEVHNGDFEQYKIAINWFMSKWYRWNQLNGWRCLNPNLFDSRPGENGAWRDFQIYQPHLDRITNEISVNYPLGSTAPPPPPPNPNPGGVNYVVVVHLLPQNATISEKHQVVSAAHSGKQSVLQSADDAARIVSPGLPGSRVVVWNPERWQGNIVEWLHDNGVTIVDTRYLN